MKSNITTLESYRDTKRENGFHRGDIVATVAGFPDDFSAKAGHRICFAAAFIGAVNERASARSARIFNDEYRGSGRFTFDKTGDDVNRVSL